ncbi:MAG: hypothetical protein WBJ23_09760 [Anaerolineaceae bacterium]|nr:hypothetical protein [Chloroflexota bacterium]
MAAFPFGIQDHKIINESPKQALIFDVSCFVSSAFTAMEWGEDG